MKRMILTGTMLLTAALLSGGEFITASAPGDFIGGGKASISNGETTVSGRAVLYSKRKLDIDTKKRYRLSGEFKAGAGSRNGDYFRFGVYPATNNSQIQAVHINIVPGTDTELAADCKVAGQRKFEEKLLLKMRADLPAAERGETAPEEEPVV